MNAEALLFHTTRQDNGSNQDPALPAPVLLSLLTTLRPATPCRPPSALAPDPRVHSSRPLSSWLGAATSSRLSLCNAGPAGAKELASLAVCCCGMWECDLYTSCCHLVTSTLRASQRLGCTCTIFPQPSSAIHAGPSPRPSTWCMGRLSSSPQRQCWNSCRPWLCGVDSRQHLLHHATVFAWEDRSIIDLKSKWMLDPRLPHGPAATR